MSLFTIPSATVVPATGWDGGPRNRVGQGSRGGIQTAPAPRPPALSGSPTVKLLQLGVAVAYHHEAHPVGSEGFCYTVERFHLVAYFSLRASTSLPIIACTPSIIRL